MEQQIRYKSVENECVGLPVVLYVSTFSICLCYMGIYALLRRQTHLCKVQKSAYLGIEPKQISHSDLLSLLTSNMPSLAVSVCVRARLLYSFLTETKLFVIHWTKDFSYSITQCRT